VLHNCRECGTIIYDSKNHKRFLNDHVTKLAQDQLAARAEHAAHSVGRVHVDDVTGYEPVE
jgi:hypothetical protein